MPKVDLETIKFVVQRNEPDIRKVAAIMQELELELKAEEEEKALKPPAVKKQWAIMISDPEGKLRDENIVGWACQIPEDDDLSTAPSRIHKAAYEFNTTPKGIRMPVETIGEACECIQAKFFKEQDISVRTKTPVLILPVDNKIPMDRSE